MTTPPQMYSLAKSLETGRVWPKNLSQAFKIYHSLAKQNYPPALVSCAYCFCHGIGVAIDIARAVQLVKQALRMPLSAHEKNVSFFVLGCGYDMGYFEGARWVQSVRLAEYFYKLSYNPLRFKNRPSKNQGYYLAGIFLGRLYALQHNHPEAIKYFFAEFETLKKMAEKEDPVAQIRLGSCYFFGYGTCHNREAAFEYYKRAAMQNMAMAQYNLGAMYSKGDFVSKDEAYAADWFLRAAKQGFVLAQIDLVNCYVKGRGVNKDYQLAMFCLREAAKSDYLARQACSCLIVATEVFPSEAAFTTAKDPRPILTTAGGEDAVALVGYETINHIAFMAVFTHPQEVEMSQGLVLDNLFRLAHKKIICPIQVSFSYQRLSKNIKACILAIQALFAKSTLSTIYLTMEKVKSTSLLDARTGQRTDYLNYPPSSVSSNASCQVKIVYRPN
jgi:TPR repeat protein